MIKLYHLYSSVCSLTSKSWKYALRRNSSGFRLHNCTEKTGMMGKVFKHKMGSYHQCFWLQFLILVEASHRPHSLQPPARDFCLRIVELYREKKLYCQGRAQVLVKYTHTISVSGCGFPASQSLWHSWRPLTVPTSVGEQTASSRLQCCTEGTIYSQESELNQTQHIVLLFLAAVVVLLRVRVCTCTGIPLSSLSLTV